MAWCWSPRTKLTSPFPNSYLSPSPLNSDGKRVRLPRRDSLEQPRTRSESESFGLKLGRTVRLVARCGRDARRKRNAAGPKAGESSPGTEA